VPLNAAPFALASGDFNADGRLDVVAANPEADSATVIINGATTTDTGTSIATAAQAYPAALYEDIGIKVRATPRLHPNAEVTLQMQIEVRDLAASTFNGIPVISNRTVEQTLRLRDGETTVLSGIVTADSTTGIAGWPWTSTVPFAGQPTGSRRREQRDTELLITLTPHRLRLAPRKSRSIYAGPATDAAPPAPPPQP
jgi:general secretion pathway protein D